MQLYLIRHAHAADGADDAARPLSRRGRVQIRAMAALLKPSAAFAAREFWHSPLVRAKETARLFALRMGVRARLREVAVLEPGGDPAHLVRCLEKRRKPLALVGHEPQLSALASLLLGGGDRGPVVLMKKCAVLALERAHGRWMIRGLISPGFPLPGD